MKKFGLSLMSCLFSLQIFAQVVEKPKVYDYQETKHEISFDVVPLFGGNMPTSFFYRKNYESVNERQVGFRLGLTFMNQLDVPNNTVLNFPFENELLMNYFISLGKEWQTPILHNFVGYSGIDVGFGFDNRRYSGLETAMPHEIQMVRFQRLTYNLTGFWGVKYHIMPRLSIFAEMGIGGSYINSSIYTKTGEFNAESQQIDSSDNFNLRLLPLRNLRVAYHF